MSIQLFSLTALLMCVNSVAAQNQQQNSLRCLQTTLAYWQIARCTSARQCGQFLRGTSCGCTRDLVARRGADASLFYRLNEQTRCFSQGVTICDCPEVEFVCNFGICGTKVVDRTPTPVVDKCQETREEYQRISQCTSAGQCGQFLRGTSCGCTRNLVARNDADATRFYELNEESRCFSQGVTICDCPEVEFVCNSGTCGTRVVDRTPTPVVDKCQETRDEYERIAHCTADNQCGQLLRGTSCGCTRNLVARVDADATRFYQLNEESRCFSQGVTICDCPEVEFVCTNNLCSSNVIPQTLP